MAGIFIEDKFCRELCRKMPYFAKEYPYPARRLTYSTIFGYVYRKERLECMFTNNISSGISISRVTDDI